MRKSVLIILSILIVAGIGVLVQVYEPQGEQAEKPAPEDKKLINEKGEEWGPLPEVADFTVSSKSDAYPVIVSGFISPLDVHVRDTQYMKIVVNGDAPLVEVLAEIETDNDIRTVPMELTESSALTEDIFNNRKYIINEDGELLINNSSIKELVSGLFRKAEAQGVVQYTYEGEWVVEDTHVKTYHTTFVVRDELGRSNNFVMAWSDPCTGIRSYGPGADIVTVSCALSAIEGVDAGNVTLNPDVNVTINTGGKFVWNDGYSITIGSGYFTLNEGGEILQANIYLTDGDGDNYAPNSIKALSGDIRMKDAIGVTDCNDGDDDVYRDIGSLSTDVDNDGYILGTSSGTQCVGATAGCSANYYKGTAGTCVWILYSARSGTNDCNDANSGDWWDLYTDYDEDGHCEGSGLTCVGYDLGYTSSCTDYVDCSGASSALYQDVASLSSDNDQDGWTDTGPATRCVGSSCSVSGRTYYKNAASSCIWLTDSQKLGTSDCNDGNSSVYQNGYEDADGDGYGVGSFGCLGGGVSANNDDCYDVDFDVNPGQTTYFNQQYQIIDAGSSWDYNCSGTADKQYTTTGGRCGSCVNEVEWCDPGISGRPGWSGSARACGTSGTYYTYGGMCPPEPDQTCEIQRS